jgi:hypothetical protein
MIFMWLGAPLSGLPPPELRTEPVLEVGSGHELYSRTRQRRKVGLSIEKRIRLTF